MHSRRDKLYRIADGVRLAVVSAAGTLKGRKALGFSHGGDTQFDIDEMAEAEAIKLVEKELPEAALYTEDFIGLDDKKDWLLVIDPIDGTRSAAAGLEMATVSIALAPNKKNATLGDVQEALIMELKTGAWVYANRNRDGVESGGYAGAIPNLNSAAHIDNLFWSIEFNGHPSRKMIESYGHIIDRTSNSGGIFVFSSSTYSILKIITGQLDAYVDIGNRLLRDNPSSLKEFKEVGKGSVLHLFPYDIAAIALVAEKAGVVITDAYGKALHETRLCDATWENQQSCIAASNSTVHSELLNQIRWGA